MERIYGSGSQQLIVGDPQNKITHYLATHIELRYYYNRGFCNPIVSAGDPKEGRDPPVEKHWSRRYATITSIVPF